MSLMHVWYGRIPGSSWNHVTDDKLVEKLLTVTGLRIGRVPIGLSSECIDMSLWFYSFPFN